LESVIIVMVMTQLRVYGDQSRGEERREKRGKERKGKKRREEYRDNVFHVQITNNNK
jgi:hypothetical protein